MEKTDMLEPKFKPKPGQIDYTHARWCPVINVVVMHRGKILIVKRSKHLRFYPGLWNGIGGFLDDKKSLEEKVREELHEELGIKPRDIILMKFGQIFDADDPKIKKTWVIHPVLVKVRTNKIRLDWEAEEYRWVRPKEVKDFRIVPSFRRVLNDPIVR
jgi:8-oxo-dGTP pyrophosphatase MutT (NUDIX family)